MKIFYLQVQKDNIITDAIEYAYEDYIPIELESLPVNILGGWFKYEGGEIVEHPELKPSQNEHFKELRVEQVKQIVEEEVGKQFSSQTAKIDYYEKIDKNMATIEELRAAKFDAIKETCDNKILAGFHSPSMDADFGFSLTDQMNMTQSMIIFMINPNPIMWKTEDKGLIEITKEQFVQIGFEAGAHKEKQINHWWQLKANILAAQTKEEIMKIEWEGTIL